MSETAQRTVTVRRHGAVAELTLNRPDALNALSTAMASALVAATAELAADRECAAVVLSAAGDRAFCVGADLKERNRLSDAELREQREVFRAAFGGVLHLPQPTVAAVFGFALGGGYEFALSCDVIIAAATAVVGLPETSVGLVPGGGGTQLALRRLGPARAADLIFTARRVPAEEAAGWGGVDRVVPAGRARAEALALADRIAGNSPVALRAAKRALRSGWGLDYRAAMDVEDSAWRTAAFSADRAEGIAAFNEKRPPRWSGR